MSAIKRVVLMVVALAFMAAPIWCQTPATVTTFADVTLSGSVQQVSTAVSSTASCRWVLFVALPANVAAVRVGDSNVSATRGIPVAASGGVIPPMSAQGSSAMGYVYPLAGLYVFGTSGDQVSITCGN
jgi:hypothetical protein